jgi:hypothetical protein
MDMRRLKTIAICFSLTVATLASQDVSAEPAKKYDRGRALLLAKKAFGGHKAFFALALADREVIVQCVSLQWCVNHFEGKLGPDNLEAVRAKLNPSH